jgi:hypothetical protein
MTHLLAWLRKVNSRYLRNQLLYIGLLALSSIACLHAAEFDGTPVATTGPEIDSEQAGLRKDGCDTKGTCALNNISQLNRL